MHNTDIFIKRTWSQIKKMQSRAMFQTRLLFPLATLPSERPETSIISEYKVSIFRDVKAAVTAAANIVCNSGLDIGDMIAKYNETEDE